jgi:hypothetical protein
MRAKDHNSLRSHGEAGIILPNTSDRSLSLMIYGEEVSYHE